MSDPSMCAAGPDPIGRELRLVRAELAELRAELRAALTPPAGRAAAALLGALWTVFGQAPFTSTDVVDAIALDLPARRALRAALEAALAGKAPTAERLGRRLADLAERSTTAAGVRLDAPCRERGVRVWALRQVGLRG